MRARHSIRWQIQFWYGLLLAAVLAGLSFSALELERGRLDRTVDDDLRRRVMQIARALRPPGPPPAAPGLGPAEAPPGPPLDFPWALDGDGGHHLYYALWLHNGPRLTRSAGAPPDIPRPRGSGEGLRVRAGWHEAYVIPHPGDCILVGGSTGPEEAALRRFALILAAVAAGILTLGLAGGAWLVGRALRPIGLIAEAANRIAAGDLSRRIEAPKSQSELGALVAVLNDSFARLEAAFARQARFTADAAHELRTPVTVMLMHAQNGLAAEGGTEEQKEAFAACQRSAQHMRRLIESLLQLARLDSAAAARPAARFSLGGPAGEAAERLRPLAAARRIAIELDLAPAPCAGDPARIEQVAANLIDNAIHYNRDGGRVRVATRREGAWSTLAVTDTGTGIAAEHLPHVFERFYRADPARTTQAGRSGLGLAIARAVVEAHGGTIEVSSEPGLGTTFLVRLPAG
ncbi:MAG TPA: ATP-binding protein [Opitutaceae bacterium]|nr:ATP-binding protein [Opitutaceae bacterium]